MAQHGERGAGAAAFQVVRRGWSSLVVAIVLSYVLLLGGSAVAANIARGLVSLQVHWFEDANGRLPLSVGLLSYLEGFVLVGIAIGAAGSALLAACVELTRSVRAGERVRPWTPFRRGLRRVPAVLLGLLVVIPRLVLLLIVATALLVLSVVTVPVAALTGLVWLVRPSWRAGWMRWPLIAAAPFGVLAFTAVRWALWLPFVVVDGTGARSALRGSRNVVRSSWWKTARPLGGLLVVGSALAALIVVLSHAGANQTVVGLSSLLIALALLMGSTVTVTVLHEEHAGAAPTVNPRRGLGGLGFRPSPGFVMALVACLSLQALWITKAPSAVADPISTYVVNSATDDLNPNLGVECLTPVALCTLRGAVLQLKAAPVPNAVIGFSVGGTINLQDTLTVNPSVTIDGFGQHITLQNATGAALFFNTEGPAGQEVPPGTFALRNITINGVAAGSVNASGLRVGNGNVTIENDTFTNHHTIDPGAAISAAGHVTVLNSTFSENAGNIGTGGAGGAVYSLGGLTVLNSTFVNSHGGSIGAASFAIAPTIWNSLFLGGDGGFNCPMGTGEVVSGNVSNDASCAALGDASRTNLTDLQLALGALQDNGGWVATYAIGQSSAAVGAAQETCPATDARGESRPIAPTPCDAGAYQTNAGTTTTIAANLNPAPYGEPVQVTVAVQHPTGTPTGSVELSGYPSGPATAALDGSGQAVFSLTGLPVGPYTLTATYVPDASLATSSSTLNLVIEQQISATALTVAPSGGTSASGAPITLTANVTNAANSLGIVPTGDVDFYSDATLVGTAALVSGVATSNGIVLAGGLHSLTAVYNGSTGFAGSTSTAVLHAVQSTSVVTFTAPASSVYGTALALSASVDAGAGSPVATGQVTFVAVATDASASYTIAFAALNATGVASATTSAPLPVGSYNLTATYNGDGSHAAGASTAVLHVVSAASTSTALVGSSSSSVFGEPVTFTATVAPTATLAVPTGAVTFTVDGALQATVPLTAGTAIYTPTDLAASGSAHSIVATYVPDTTGFLASAPPSLLHTVQAATTTIGLTVPAASVAGESVSLVATVTASSPSVAVPPGTVAFASSGNALGSAALVNGVATLVVTSLPIGSQTLTATFAASTNLLGSSSSPVAHVVTKAATDVALTANPTSPKHGQPATLTATVAVTAPGGGTPTGTVVFKDGATILGTAPVIAGVAVLPVSTLQAGDRALTASYGGDARYAAHDGLLTVVVAKAIPVVAITSVTPSPARFGSPVTMTASIVSPTGSTPTGTVDFSFGSTSIVVGTVPVVNGVATLTTSDLFIAHTVVAAHYLGDPNHADAYTPNASDADLTYLTVQRAIPVVAVSTSVNPTSFGDVIVISADAASVNGHIPGGSVHFRIVNTGFAPTTSFDASGHASTMFVGVHPGDIRIIVTVDADFYFDASDTQYDGHHVDVGTATVTVAASPSAPTAGTATTLTATLGPAATSSIGSVTFYDGAVAIGSAPVDFFSHAAITTTFATAGPHVITATYDGGFGFFHSVTSAPLTVAVPGRPLSVNAFPTGAEYGNPAQADAVFFSFDTNPPLPTGTFTVTEGAQTLGTAPVTAISSLGFISAHALVSVGSNLAPGLHNITISYSGDAVWAATSATTTINVSPRTLTLTMDPPSPNPAVAGEPVNLVGRLTIPPGLAAPTGTLTMGNGSGSSCTVTLQNGATGASCFATFANTGTPQQVSVSYSGDGHYAAVQSPPVALTVTAAQAFIDLTTPYRISGSQQVWTNTEPVAVTWAVVGGMSAHPTGTVQVWTNEGMSSCPSGVSGTCNVRFHTVTSDAWIEIRYSGDTAFPPTTKRNTANVVGCFNVFVQAPGHNTTAANCGGTKFLAGTPVTLETTTPAGYTLVGWSSGPGSPQGIQPSPIYIFEDRFLEPRFEPICFSLTVELAQRTLPRISPAPPPNCDDTQGADFSTRNLDAIRTAEVASGVMRYRVGTRVSLAPFNIRLAAGGPDGMSVRVGFVGDGVGADGVITLDRDRTVREQILLPCQAFVVDGPPGSTAAVTSSFLDVSKSTLLAGRGNGACTRADGTAGYITGTTLKLSVTPPSGTWFDHWGSVETLAGHHAPTGVTNVSARPADITAIGSTTVVVPDHDSAISGFAAGVTCFQLTIQLHDAVPANQLRTGDKGPSATATAPNCPAWWLTEHKISTQTPDGAQPARWYVGGTQVTVTADSSTRRGYVDEYTDSQQIYFRRWTGGITGDAPVQKITMDGTVAASAEWYVATKCVRMVVRAVPVDAGDVSMSDLGTDCPLWQSQFANVAPTPQAVLGSQVSLASRPKGSLQTIWKVEGTSITKTEACRRWEDLIAQKRQDGADRGVSRAQTDLILMQQGYLPGYVAAQIQELATADFAKGYTQQNIIDDLKTMGLLDASGAAVPDRLRDNPCNSKERDTTLPPGQRIITLAAEGNLVATAYFCQAVVPSVTIIGLDGTSSPATAQQLNAFGPTFTSSNKAGNCPSAAWFLPGTTAVLGSNGAGVPGYKIEKWTLDGVDAPAGPLSVPITTEGAAHKVGLTVRVQCQPLTVNADYGYTAYPLPDCPGNDPTHKLYAQGTRVTVTATGDSGHVWQGWKELGTAYNPTVVVMDKPMTLTTQFRSKTVGEQITETVIDPAINALGVAAKKTVGGVAYLTKVFAQTVIEDTILKGLSAIGDGLAAGFHAIGVDGKVLDGIVLGLQTPANSFAAGLAGFDCVEEWAWGRKVPTLNDLQDVATAAVTGQAKTMLRGVDVDDVVAQAQAIAARAAAGDPAAITQASVAAAGGTAPAMILTIALDIQAHPDVWAQRAKDVGSYALTVLEEQFGKPFTWETSASDAWSTGGDAFLQCMANNGKAMAGK